MPMGFRAAMPGRLDSMSSNTIHWLPFPGKRIAARTSPKSPPGAPGREPARRGGVEGKSEGSVFADADGKGVLGLNDAVGQLLQQLGLYIRVVGVIPVVDKLIGVGVAVIQLAKTLAGVVGQLVVSAVMVLMFRPQS